MELAKEYTGIKNNNTAIERFIQEVQGEDMYFNDKPFPAKESGNEAFINCYDTKSAEASCPERFKAMNAWIANTEKASNWENMLYSDSWRRQFWPVLMGYVRQRQGTLLLHCLSLTRWINGYRRIKFWGYPCDRLASHPGGVVTLLVASCCKHRSKALHYWTAIL